MTLDDAIAALASAGNVLPREAMRWTLDYWDEAAPRLIAMLDAYATGGDRSDKAAEALFFAVHLLGAQSETRAFPALCRLLHDAEASETVLGDAITESLRGILISTFDGDLPRLKRLIEDAEADDFVRAAALLVLAYFARTGRVADSDMRDYLDQLRGKLRPLTDEIVLCEWAMAAAYLGYEDFVPRVETLFRHADMQGGLIDLRDFRGALQDTLADPTGMTGFERDHVRPFTDAIAELEHWSSFSEQATVKDLSFAGRDDDDPAWLSGAEQPYVNPYRHVGRNNPCPCGSGKKFKKCCLPRAA